MGFNDFITIKEGIKLKDSDGTPRIVDIKMRANSYLGDVYIYFKEKAVDKKGYHLMDDEVLIGGVMTYLKRRGYNGPVFDRAEMGMQENKLVILEPNEEFEVWAAKKFGFIKRSV